MGTKLSLTARSPALESLALAVACCLGNSLRAADDVIRDDRLNQHSDDDLPNVQQGAPNPSCGSVGCPRVECERLPSSASSFRIL
mgnify:CR=1 FL=1